MIDWNLIQHFSPDENWGDVTKMEFDIVHLLDRYREFIASPVIVTCAIQGMHKEKSLHYVGAAVDIVIPHIDLLDAWIAALRFDFTGIGFYPDWYFKSKKVGGLHLEYDSNWVLKPKKLWLGTGAQNFDTKYYEMNGTNLKIFYLQK